MLFFSKNHLKSNIKRFQIDPENEIVWQKKYSDREIVDLVAGKY
jgi:hypothetical protein